MAFLNTQIDVAIKRHPPPPSPPLPGPIAGRMGPYGPSHGLDGVQTALVGLGPFMRMGASLILSCLHTNGEIGCYYRLNSMQWGSLW